MLAKFGTQRCTRCERDIRAKDRSVFVTPPIVIAYKFWIRQKRLRDYRANFGDERYTSVENYAKPFLRMCVIKA